MNPSGPMPENAPSDNCDCEYLIDFEDGRGPQHRPGCPAGKNRPYDPDALERAAIALAADCTRLWLGGNHAPAWHEVHEDVREEYRRQVRLILDAYEADRLAVELERQYRRAGVEDPKAEVERVRDA